jgi:hypothetical protein
MSNTRGTQLKEWLSGLAPKYGLDVSSLAPASSDASFRAYYRICAHDNTYIVMDSPPPMENIRPFILVDGLMLEAGLNAPKIYEADRDMGFMLLEDLGRQTYLDVLNAGNANRLMDDAIAALIKWQASSRPGVLPDYSREMLLRELELFPTWYVEKHLQQKIEPADREMLTKMFNLILDKVLAQAKVFVHRDYMPRNLMFEEKDNPGVLDFQDAVYGPVSYDIASLCRDAFLSWDEAVVIDWTIRYWERARAANLPVPSDFGSFWEDVEWMGLQRHLKVLGIFARINYRDGKPKYLADTPRFVAYVKSVVTRYDDLKPLAKYFERLTKTERAVGYTF